VDFAIWSLFNKAKEPGAPWPKHILCDGFRKRVKEGDPTGTSIPDVYSLYPNHHAASLRQEPWPRVLALLGRSGQKIMLDLLVGTAIFVTIGAGIDNYQQINGKHLNDSPGWWCHPPNVLTSPRRPPVRSRQFERQDWKYRQTSQTIRYFFGEKPHFLRQTGSHGAWSLPAWL
jgi:hypothetical protein